MKKEDLFYKIADIDDDYILKAGEYSVNKKHGRNRRLIMAASAAVLIIAVIAVSIISRGKISGPTDGYPFGVTKVLAAYPAPVAEGMSAERFGQSDEFMEWNTESEQKASRSKSLQTGINGYYTSVMQEILGSGDDNAVCSPLNMYIALAMLAEVTDGNSRTQILDMLGVSDIDALREQVQCLWESNYVDIPIAKSIPANSLWLSDTESYNTDTLQRLAEQYYASTFSGTPGSKEMNEALRTWMNKNTFGLLSEYIKDITIDPEAVLEIVSTLYYKAVWNAPFSPDKTTTETFHGTKGDTSAEMMHQTMINGYAYGTDTYTAVKLWLSGGGSMCFYLPDEGVNVETLILGPDILAPVTGDIRTDKNWFPSMIHLSLPKFKISKKLDMIDMLEKYGVTDVLSDVTSDFTPLSDNPRLYLSAAGHAAVLEVDEEGVTGAAYTIISVNNTSMPSNEIDLVFDRPFMFVLAGKDGSVLFSGVVRNTGLMKTD
ncbi:MAG: serpin family protein [Lachnospiraceae bacterium]|nr:serpin family protein [Lachnospiraceae bacterium]